MKRQVCVPESLHPIDPPPKEVEDHRRRKPNQMGNMVTPRVWLDTVPVTLNSLIVIYTVACIHLLGPQSAGCGQCVVSECWGRKHVGISQILWLVYKLDMKEWVRCFRDHISSRQEGLPKDLRLQVSDLTPGSWVMMNQRSGVSAGSVVAAMLAIGCDAEAIFKLTPGGVDQNLGFSVMCWHIFSPKKLLTIQKPSPISPPKEANIYGTSGCP